MQVYQLRPASLLQTDEGPFLEMPDEWNAGSCHQHFMAKGYRLPVQQGIDDVRLYLSYRFAPVLAGEILDVSERQRPDSVVPIRILHPQPVQLVPLLFQG